MTYVRAKDANYEILYIDEGYRVSANRCTAVYFTVYVLQRSMIQIYLLKQEIMSNKHFTRYFLACCIHLFHTCFSSEQHECAKLVSPFFYHSGVLDRSFIHSPAAFATVIIIRPVHRAAAESSI